MPVTAEQIQTIKDYETYKQLAGAPDLNVRASRMTYVEELWRNTKKSGPRGNSVEYKHILDSLKHLSDIMNTKPLGQSDEEDLQVINAHIASYEQLKQYCLDYDHKNKHPKSAKGKERKATVNVITNMVTRDLNRLKNVKKNISMYTQQQRKDMTLYEIIQNGDARLLNFDPNITDTDGISQGVVSDVYKLTGKNTSKTTGDNLNHEETKIKTSRIFKERNIVKPQQQAVTVLENYFRMHPDEREKITGEAKAWLYDMIQSYSPGSLDHATAITSIFNEKSNQTDVKQRFNYPDDFVACSRKVFGAFSGNIQKLGLQNKQQVDITSRNVATSHYAKLLNLDRLVVKSRYAVLTEKKSSTDKTDNTKKWMGIEMHVARGTEGTSILGANDLLRLENEIKAHKKDPDYNWDTVQPVEKPPAPGPGFFRDLASLQVFDALCLQLDRHMGNYFVEKDENNMMSGVQGIDNDAAFGLLDQLPNSDDSWGRRVYDDNDGHENLVIPYMDLNLANSIMALSESKVREDLCAFLDKDELEHTITRLKKMKRAISKEMQSGKSHRLLKNENDWFASDVQCQMLQTVAEGQQKTYLAEYQKLQEEIKAANNELEELKANSHNSKQAPGVK